MVEHLTVNQRAAGSSPASGASSKKQFGYAYSALLELFVLVYFSIWMKTKIM